MASEVTGAPWILYFVVDMKFTTMIEALHTGMMANVSVGGEVSESFSVTNGVKQGGHPRSSPSSYQQCLTRLSETWGWRLHTVQTESADLFNVAHFRRPRLLGY